MDEDTQLRVGLVLLGAKIRARRQDLGLDLATCADRAGLSLAYLSQIEYGDKEPALNKLLALAAALETTVSELVADVYPFGPAAEPADLPQRLVDGRRGTWR